jgi:hypothetical protein
VSGLKERRRGVSMAHDLSGEAPHCREGQQAALRLVEADIICLQVLVSMKRNNFPSVTQNEGEIYLSIDNHKSLLHQYELAAL